MQKERAKQISLNTTKRVVLIGVMTAVLTGGKMALSFLPNIEVVTLFTALFGYVFGWAGVISILFFVLIEPLIWGFGTWFFSYLIYWPLVAVVFWILGKFKVKNRFLLTGVALLLTLFFGVLSSLVDVGLFSGNFQNFFTRFSIYYLRGITFYVLQLACNLLIFLFVFPVLSPLLQKLQKRFFTYKSRVIREEERDKQTEEILPQKEESPQN